MDSIFVSIATYRDPDTINTIKDAYEKAQFKGRITFGVLYQGTKDELNKFLQQIVGDKVFVKYVPYEETKGTGWARNILTRDMLKHEDYWLQIDSHTRFKQNWDTEIIKTYNLIGKECLMSAYPPHFGMSENYEQYSERKLNNKAVVIDFTEMHSFRDTKGFIPDKTYEDSITASGAFQFALNKVAKSLTFDEYFNPWMDQEISSCLAYMSGYDIVAPRDAVLWHCYEDNHIGSNEKWRGLVADEVNVKEYDGKPFETIKKWQRKRTWQEWHDRVLQDINFIKHNT